MNRLILFLSIILAYSQQALSAGPSAADVTYRHLKNMEYEVTIVAYRDCRSIPWSMFGLKIYNDSFSISTTTTRSKIEDISYYCPTKPCNPSNSTGSKEGLEAHYFTDTIDFNSGVYKKFVSKNYCKVYFALNTCCRNGAITTMSPGNLFVEAMLNLCLAKSAPVNSPQFINTITNYAPCNLNFSYTFYANNYFSGDSVSYELVKAKNDANSYETNTGGFNEKIPMTPLCSPPGVINCTPSATTLPARGITFNPKNGNFIFTPTNCVEVGVVVCQVNVFRKDSGKYKLAGYSKRDMMLIVRKGATNKPYLTTYRDNYTIKARENYCVDIKIKDDTTKTTKDTVRLVVKEFPKYGTLSLLDSNAREKTMHFCWNATDSDYLKKKEARIVIYAYDKPCYFAQDMSTVINFKVVAPDSLTNITIKTYYDINKNGKKDAGEPYRTAPILSQFNQNPGPLQTDANGMLTIKPIYGKFTYNINRSQFVYSTVKDTVLDARFDSSHVVELGFNNKQGIRGKVYEDVNNNCSYDIGTDLPLRGFTIMSQSANAAALSDINGDYLFNSSIGKHSLTIDNNTMYEATCNSVLNTEIAKDSQFLNYDFPLRRKTTFTDISLALQPQHHQRNSAKMTQSIIVENKGLTKARNFYIKMVPSINLFQFSSTLPTNYSKDTILWLIDSMSPNSKKTIDFSHTLMSGNFSNGDQITYQVWAAYIDSVSSNNYHALTETITDTACCITKKSVYAPSSYYPINKTITYKLQFIPKGNTKRALISDRLDTNRFDLRTLKILSLNNNPTSYINGNMLYAEFALSSFINHVELVYSISLKQPVTDSFTVYNSATCDFDYQTLQTSNITANNIISPILYDTFVHVQSCSDETINLAFSTAYQAHPTNHFKVYLSDSTGNFSQPSLLLDTATYAIKNILKVKLPEVSNANIYRLKVTGSHPATEAFTSITLPSLTIHPLPATNYTTNLNNSKICYKDTLKLSASGTHEYQFARNGIPMTGFSKDSIYKEQRINNATYTILFKSDKGCISQSPGIIADINPLPVVKMSVNDQTLCEGEILTFTFSGANTYTLLKNTNTAVVSGLTASPYAFIPVAGKNDYSIAGNDLNGCRDTANAVNITVHALPAKPTITRIGRALQTGFSIKYQWYNLIGKIDSAVNQNFYPPVDGKYFVKHIDSNGCENTSNLYDVNYTATANIDNQKAFDIFPNPASDYLTIENLEDQSFIFELTDAYGRSIIKAISESRLQTISTANLNSGQYVLKITFGERFMNYRIVIVK